MIEIKDKGRIIGDFFEINSEILHREVNSKLPSILSKIQANMSRKKLLKSLDKLYNSNYILGRDNLIELFMYIYNNFPPNGTYKSIKICKVLENGKNIEAVIIENNFKAIISIDTDEENFEIIASEKIDEIATESCSISLSSLYYDGPRSNLISKINNKLLDIMVDYIKNIIEIYIKRGE